MLRRALRILTVPMYANHKVLGGGGPTRTTWRQHCTDARTRDRSSLKRPRENVSHGSAVTLDRLSCVIPLAPQATLVATSELVMRTNASNVSAGTSAHGDLHVAPSACPKLAMLTVVEGQPVRVEERGRIGTPSHYRRIFPTCQEHCESGAASCRIRRNTGSRQTSTLGSNDALAYGLPHRGSCDWYARGPCGIQANVFADTRICEIHELDLTASTKSFSCENE